MIFKAYAWAFRKVLDRRLRRDIALFRLPCPAGDPESVGEVNKRYISRRVSTDLDAALSDASRNVWLSRVIDAGFLANLLAIAYRLVRPESFAPHYSEIGFLALTLSTLMVVFWGVSVVHNRLCGLMDDDERVDEQPRVRSTNVQRERNTILYVNALTTITIALLTVSLIPNVISTVSLIPVTLMTIVLGAQRTTHRVISEDLSSTELRDYLQQTQAFYPASVMDNIFLRELEGTPTSIRYLMHRQVDPTAEQAEQPD